MKLYKFLISLTLFVAGLFLGAALIVKLDLDKSTKAIIFEESQKEKSDPEQVSSLQSLEEAFIKVAEEVGPAVVSIISERTQTVGGNISFPPLGTISLRGSSRSSSVKFQRGNSDPWGSVQV